MREEKYFLVDHNSKSFYTSVLLPLCLVMVNNQFPDNDPEKIETLSLRLIDDILLESKSISEAKEKLESAIRYLKGQSTI